MTPFKHCDDYINDFAFPKFVRVFLLLHRMPAVDMSLLLEYETLPWRIFANYKGKRVALVMASRMGDVGIVDTDITKSYKYNTRVYLEELSNFGLEA